MIYADQNMVDLIIRNLVSNALKFTSSQGRITIAVMPDETTSAIVSVSDTGVGIEPEDLKKLLRIDAHHSTAGTAQERGSGLGLIVCKEMVERNGGRIWVESKPGKGTSVKFSVQLDQASSAITSQALREEDMPRKIPRKVSETVSERLMPPPADELNALLDMALRGDLLGIEIRADQIEKQKSYESFTRTLRRLAGELEDEKVIAFIKQYLT